MPAASDGVAPAADASLALALAGLLALAVLVARASGLRADLARDLPR